MKIYSAFVTFTCTLQLCIAQCLAGGTADDRTVQVRYAQHRTTTVKKHWVGVAQCQVAIEPERTPNGVYAVKNAAEVETGIKNCLTVAQSKRADVVVLPELALAMEPAARDRIVGQMSALSLKTGMIIVAGSYYDESRRSTLLVVGPGWIERGYKIRQSRFEVSPVAGKGMAGSNELLVLKTDFGNFAVFTCVDLISDTVQGLARGLATSGEVDMLININHNPAAWEFLIEANNIVRRHPVFVSITNAVVSSSAYDKTCYTPEKSPFDSGYCYGHTAVFAGLKDFRGDISLPEVMRLKEPAGQLAYNQMVGDAGTFAERALTYELNMWMTRAPDATNAPDQGYPTIRNLEVVDLAPK